MVVCCRATGILLFWWATQPSFDRALPVTKSGPEQHPTCAWDSFITYRRGATTTSAAGAPDSNGSVWAHDFGTTGEVLRPSGPNATTLSSHNGTMTFRIDAAGELIAAVGPNVTFEGLPYAILRLCGIDMW